MNAADRSIRKRLKVAQRVMEGAQKEVAAVVRESYPPGSRVRVSLLDRKIEGKVVGYGAWFTRPSWIRIENVTTGRLRDVNAVGDEIESLIAEPEKEATHA